ncbi:MAG: YidC/Oxa1 family insertase periplasmic-domain containing protein [Endomicrobia bacterium]|nr:YidC/Oxa1 family insertase periplasmic-domain containing protein [Endomicrobiia bacterium]
MEKRVLLATLLSLGFLFLWQYLTFQPHQHKDKITQSVSTQKDNVILENKEKPSNIEPYSLETKYLNITFNTYTGGMLEVSVKEEPKNNFVSLIKENKDMLGIAISGKYDIEKIVNNKEIKIIFASKKDKIRQIYTISEDKPYFLTREIHVDYAKSFNFTFEHFVNSDEPTVEPNTAYVCKGINQQQKELLLVEKINKDNFTKEDKIKWVAVSSRYFLAALIFDENFVDTINIDKFNKNSKRVVIKTLPFTYKKLEILFAPKRISLLKNFQNKFVQTVDWGAFAPLSKLFYNILTFLYKKFNNYGLAIIGLTIILQILTFPLTYNSFKATFKMKQIQPHIQVLQKVYKDDPKRLNLEIMNLYKEKKVNPFGGCLPLLLQIPIFWALFTMLRNTYDLRGANFILWIKDLSQPDKLLIPGTSIGLPVLVLLMGITMFIQQVVSGVFSDPQQRTMGIVMPVVFTLLFFNFPSGLVLYWFINNIFSISIQFLINKNAKR